MELSIQKLNTKSKEIDELQTWLKMPNTENIKKYILRDGSIDFKKLLDQHLSNTLVTPSAFAYKYNNEVVALALLQTFKNKLDGNYVCVLTELCVHPECQNLGIGANVIASIIENRDNMLGKRNYKIIQSSVSKTNAQSKRAFKKMGFEFEEKQSSYSAIYYNQPAKELGE